MRSFLALGKALALAALGLAGFMLGSCAQSRTASVPAAEEAVNAQELIDATLKPGGKGGVSALRRAEPYLDTKTMTMFPAELDGLMFQGIQDFKTAELGIGLKYGAEGANAPALDIFIYNFGSKPPKDGAGSPTLKQAFNAALAEIASFGKKGLYKNIRYGVRERVELPAAEPGKSCEALTAKLSFEMNGKGPMDSLLLLTAYKGCIFKLRFTLPQGSSAGSFEARSSRLSGAFAKLLYRSRETHVSPDTKESVLKALKALEDDPLVLGALAAPAIIVFSKESEDVAVTLSPAALPWLAAKERLKHQELLLAAYIGGNVRKQLQDGKLGDAPLEGLLCALKVYAKIKEFEPSFRSPSLEKLQKLNEEGRLQEALKDLPQAREASGK